MIHKLMGENALFEFFFMALCPLFFLYFDLLNTILIHLNRHSPLGPARHRGSIETETLENLSSLDSQPLV